MKTLLLLIGFGLIPMAPVMAAPKPDMDNAPAINSTHGSSGAQHTPMSAGEIRKVDKAAGKLTIRHGELQNLDMPAMTMAFRVSDPAMLDQVKPGDKVNFVADRVKGALTVIHIEPAQ